MNSRSEVKGQQNFCWPNYGVSFALKESRQSIPLWLLIAVESVAVLWAIFVIGGIEKSEFPWESPLPILSILLPRILTPCRDLLCSAAGFISDRLARRGANYVGPRCGGLNIFSLEVGPHDPAFFRSTGSLRCPAWQALLTLQLCQAYCGGSGQSFYLDSGERLAFLQAHEKLSNAMAVLVWCIAAQ